jgi:hypothetical protein
MPPQPAPLAALPLRVEYFQAQGQTYSPLFNTFFSDFLRNLTPVLTEMKRNSSVFQQ